MACEVDEVIGVTFSGQMAQEEQQEGADSVDSQLTPDFPQVLLPPIPTPGGSHQETRTAPSSSQGIAHDVDRRVPVSQFLIFKARSAKAGAGAPHRAPVFTNGE